MSFSEGPRFKPSSFRGAHIREIVLVEQDESLRSRLIQELRPHQIKVHGFSGSNEALPVLQRSSPDLLIVDVNVKPGDGFIFSQQVRQLKSAEELPILLTSNVIFRPEVLRAAKEEYGFSEFLGKPYTLQNLLAKLRQLGGSARPSPPPAQVAAAPEPYLFFLDQLGRVARDLRTGCLRCEREDLVAQLFFRSGKLVAVDCGKVSPEELGRTLVRRKLIHESQMELLLHELEGETGDRQHRLGLLLIEQGWLRAEQLAEVHAEQAADRFKQLFGRNEGSFRFVEDLAPGSGDLRFNFNLPSLVFEALCNHARLAQLRELVERYPGTVRVAAEATDALSGVKLSAGERRLVRKLNRKTILRSLSEVSEAGERGPVVVLLLLVLGLLEADSARGNELRMRIFGLVEQPRTGSAGAGAPAPENDTEAFDRAYGRGFRHMNMGLMGQAEEDFTRALQLKAGDARALCYLAWCHFHNCRSEEGFREALELNRQAAGADPKLLPVHLLRARMLLARGRRNEALSAAMRALELEPGSSEAKELLQELVRLPQESVAQPQADVPAARPAAAEEALFGRSPSPSTAPPPLPAAGSSTPAGAPSPASPTPTRAMLVAPPPAALAAQAPPAVAAPPAMAAPPEVAATASSARTASTAPAAAPIAAAKPPPAGPPPVLAVATPRASEVETGAEATDRAASGEGAARPVAAPAPPSAKPALGTAPRSTIEEWPSSEEQAGDPGPGAPAARQVVAAAAERVAGPANFTLLVLSLVQDEAALADSFPDITRLHSNLKVEIIRLLLQASGSMEEYHREHMVCLLGYPLDQQQHQARATKLGLQIRELILRQLRAAQIRPQSLVLRAVVVSGFRPTSGSHPGEPAIGRAQHVAGELLRRVRPWEILVAREAAEELGELFDLDPFEDGQQPPALLLRAEREGTVRSGQRPHESAEHQPTPREAPRSRSDMATATSPAIPEAPRPSPPPSSVKRKSGQTSLEQVRAWTASSETTPPAPAASPAPTGIPTDAISSSSRSRPSGSGSGSGSGEGRKKATSEERTRTGPRGAEDAALAYQPGTEMGGNFVLVRRLGYGGMGQVYEALDRALGRKVAIKIMSRGALSTSSARERFRQEARALARINCPQIIQIYSLDLEFEPPFLVLEYVNGASLKETLRERKRLPVELSLQIGLEVVRGLRIAYDKGVIHRDINPRNIMLSFEGEVKIGDFGLAKSRVWDLSLTSDGAILGTPLYMSPEQWKSEPVDFRSDIYSLGITLYHLITGSPPFDAESVATVMLKHLSSPLPEATREQPGATGELMKLLRRMTAKDPAHRYSSYSELQQDMQHLLTG